MLKSILFLIGCIAITALVWGAFQIFGQYTFLIMLVISIASLFSRVGKPKFGGKK